MKRISLTIEEGDVFKIKGDVLALKYAQANFGVDRIIVNDLLRKSSDVLELLPQPGKSVVLDAPQNCAVEKVIFVGVNQLRNFNYPEIRDFGRQVLTDVALKIPFTEDIVLTLHGGGYGLDETEAFESEVAGIIDALENGAYPSELHKITIVEIDSDRVNRLQKILRELVPSGNVEVNDELNNCAVTQPVRSSAFITTGVESDAAFRLRRAGYGTEMKPHLFVAMPFASEMEDFYDYGIHGAARAAGFVCERADYSTYTGDVLEWIKDRINKATMVVADLTGANPNVYLEVGYAWGIGKNTVLLIQDEKELKFDVQGQKCLVYNRIKDLEEKLKKVLINLKGK